MSPDYNDIPNITGNVRVGCKTKFTFPLGGVFFRKEVYLEVKYICDGKINVVWQVPI